MKTKISKTQFAKQLKLGVKEYKEWYLSVQTSDMSLEAKELFFRREVDSLLDTINTIANKILKNYK